MIPERLFYVCRRICSDGSDFWLVMNSYTRRSASKTKFQSLAEAEAQRAKLQADFDRRAMRRFLLSG
jgi:hypothetical protein